jgi:hypothetical protein
MSGGGPKGVAARCQGGGAEDKPSMTFQHLSAGVWGQDSTAPGEEQGTE